MGNTVLITGGNRGIGAAIAERLASQGFGVRIVCRDTAGASDFVRALGRKGIGNVEAIEGDLGSIRSVRAAASRIRESCPEFSAFIHNAGMWPTKKKINADGLEQSFVTNHIAPFLLNRLLEDLFIANRARVVQISAGLYVLGMKDCVHTAAGDNFSLMKTYATTKFLNLITAMRFAARWKDSGVTVNAIHPGVVKTGLADPGGIRGAVLRTIKILFMSPAKSALAPAALAVDPKFDGVTGKYYNMSREATLKDPALDEDFAAEVWDQAERLCGLK